VRQSKFQLIVIFALWALTIAPTPANAAEWWLVFAEGDKPAREVHYLDLASVNIVRDPSRLMTTSFDTKLSDADLIDFIRVEGVAIYESAQSPAKAATQYRVKCRERMVAITMASRLWRHDLIEQLPDQAWTAIEGNALLSQIHAFACAPDKREANGMMRVTDEYDPMPLTWSALWTDGVEPKWTSTRSAAEINAEIDAKLAETRELLAKGAAMATAGLQKFESDRGQTIQDQQKLFSQMAQKASPVLHSWMGLPETSLVGRWGIPHQSFESGGSRFLYYAYGYTTKLVDENGYEIPQETWACHMTFEVREGLIADYRSHGNYCQTAAVNLPYGRARE
jgi:hypothetical protein